MSPFQLLLLTFGFSLMFLSLVLPQTIEMWQTATGANTIHWNQLRLVPREDQQINALDAGTLVVRSMRHPDARLTLFRRANDGSTPRDLVTDLCRRDRCTYSAMDRPHEREGAIATYPGTAALRIVLLRPGGGDIWIEYKGPPDAYHDFAELIESVAAQLGARSAAA